MIMTYLQFKPFRNFSLDHITKIEHTVLWLVAYLAACIFSYLVLVSWNPKKSLFKTLKNAKRVLIVTAHPDDESMFFGPTILQFNKMGCEVYLVCLSIGNHDDLGKIRKYELYKACKILGIPAERITIHNDQFLPDDPNVEWKEDLIGAIIMTYVESLNIDTVVTFDRDGVSQHPNHKAIYYGIAYLFMENQLPKYCKAYTLETVNILRKYSLFLDIPFSFLSSCYCSILSWRERRLIQIAMKEHDSQMVWFRSLYIMFSRYLFINTLEEITLFNTTSYLSESSDKPNI